jgi:hypothetical protein
MTYATSRLTRLLAWFRRAPKRMICDHGDWARLTKSYIRPTGRQVVRGATLGWSGRITRMFDTHWRCQRCGTEFWRRGLVSPGDDDRRWHPDCYDPDGWPIDPATGKRLELAR